MTKVWVSYSFVQIFQVVVSFPSASPIFLFFLFCPVPARSSTFLATTRRITQFSNNRPAKSTDKVVYVDGAFDLFHAGHISFLKKVFVSFFLFFCPWMDITLLGGFRWCWVCSLKTQTRAFLDKCRPRLLVISFTWVSIGTTR